MQSKGSVVETLRERNEASLGIYIFMPEKKINQQNCLIPFSQRFNYGPFALLVLQTKDVILFPGNLKRKIPRIFLFRFQGTK